MRTWPGQIEHRRSTLPSNFEDGVVEILTNINSIKLCLTRWADLSDALTLQNWVSRVSRIPGGIFGKLGGFSKSSLHVAALTKI